MQKALKDGELDFKIVVKLSSLIIDSVSSALKLTLIEEAQGINLLNWQAGNRPD